MQVYSSETAEQNGRTPADEAEDNGTDETQVIDYAELFGAPDYSTFIKSAETTKSRAYERKIQSMLKAGVVGTVNAHAFADTAAILKYGPGFAKAGGALADADERAAKVVDMLTAPDSPYFMFMLAAMPFAGQIARNHKPEIEQVGGTWRQRRAQRKAAKAAGDIPGAIRPGRDIFIKLPFGRKIRLRVGFAFNFGKMLGAFTAASQHPVELQNEVFGDQKVIKALRKMGVILTVPDPDDDE
jgi:hypothetical protein